MTLYKQLLLWMLVVFLILISAVFTVQFNTTKDYLVEQQSTELTNTINAIGFALSPYLENNDLVASESVINATFDASFYREVKLTVLASDKTIVRQYPKSVAGVPDWFQHIANIKPVTESRTLTSGWMQLADLTVTTNPAYAYHQLWVASLQLLAGFVLCSLLGGVLLAVVLRKVLTPLKQLQARTQEMANQHFTTPLPTPRTRELADLVDAFNVMNHTLQQHFEQQAQESDALRIRAYQDPISELANRSYAMTKLDSWLSHQPTGGIVLLEIAAINDVYQHKGYIHGDQLVKNIATSLKILAREETTIARLSQSEFLLLSPHSSKDELIESGRKMLDISLELSADPLAITSTQAAVGIVMCSANDTVSTLLASADNALTQAYQKAAEPLALIEPSSTNTTTTLGKQQWKQLVESAIANHNIHFTFQKAIDKNNAVLHQEVFSYITDNDTHFNAGQFLSAIEQLNAGTTFDCYIIDKLFSDLEKQPQHLPVAVNITQSSIADTGFIRWLNNKLQTMPQLKNQVLFELPEIGFIKQINNATLLCEIINQNGFRFGIDNYGHNFSSTGYLNKLRPSYVKLDFAYTSQLDDQIKADVLHSITRTANNLSVTTIATRVETPQQMDKLAAMNIIGFQGFVTDKLTCEN